jgi:glycerophosphoryl diester phosphodiesterase
MCRPELVDYARGRYLPVSVWTVDQEAAMVDMADMGVDSITTYRPKTLVDLLARRAHRPASSV